MYECIVVGAGPGGLVAIKELSEAGVSNILCLEKSHRIGGLFAGSYDSLYLTSSAAFSMFSDHWIGDDQAHVFFTKAQAVEYWAGYAEKFNVLEKIRFDTAVLDATQTGTGDWQLTLESGGRIQCKRLVVATGNNDVPVVPNWHDKATDVRTLHSRDYRNSEPFEGKRVVVVGGGESASDIALEISKVADRCWVSLRNGTGWVVPRMRNGIATDMSTHRGFWTLPRRFGSLVNRSSRMTHALPRTTRKWRRSWRSTNPFRLREESGSLTAPRALHSPRQSQTMTAALLKISPMLAKRAGNLRQQAGESFRTLMLSYIAPAIGHR